MKLITRYLLAHLRRPWIYIMAGFAIIAVLIDLFGNFLEFWEAGAPLASVLLYYAILLPTYLPYLMPVSLLLALLYALWQLGKHSEIVAMSASGLSRLQLFSPYLLVGLAASLGLLGINEWFNPWALQWTRQFRMARGRAEGGEVLRVPVAFKNVVGRRIWQIDLFDPRPQTSYELRGINLIQQRPDGSDEFRLEAARGRWMDGHWWFEQVTMRYYNSQNDPVGPVESHPELEMTMLSETPRDFLNEIKDSTERSALDILRFLKTHPAISKETRQRLLVDFHYRLAAPWLCVIVILLGIPFGIHAGRRGMGLGILFALLAFFGYYILMGLGLAYGKQHLIPPWLAGWLPNLVFLTIGLAMIRRTN